MNVLLGNFQKVLEQLFFQNTNERFFQKFNQSFFRTTTDASGQINTKF